MDKDSRSYEEKKRSSIVHKPFLRGTINLFNPPKKNPNGHLAASRLPETEPSEMRSQALAVEEFTPFEPFVPETKTTWLNGWRITAILLVFGAHLVAAVAIISHRQQAKIASTKEVPTQKYASGGTDLTQSEFSKLDLQDIKNIKLQSADDEATEDKDLPLAIPPSNLPSNIQLPTAAQPDYYYILAQYTGDRSLELAKTKVPNVSLVNFPQGMFLYLGAFTKKDAARNFVKELQQLGLESYLYPLD